jgi:hypothetical protein
VLTRLFAPGQPVRSGPPGHPIRLVFRDRRIAAVAASWYLAFLLGMQPDPAGAIAAIVIFPILLLFWGFGFWFLPGNLLTHLRLELPGSLYAVYWVAFVAVVALLHLWLYRAWRWPVFALLALLLAVSSYGCYANNPAWHDL